MRTLTFVSGNELKLRGARAICEPRGFTIEQAILDIPEIQAEEGEPVAIDKAQKAFAILQKPLVVTDDTWVIPGLNGFPGPYMKSMNHWFTAEDFLRLTLPLADRRIILRQIAVYQDDSGQKVFSVDIAGTLLTEIKGTSKYAHTTITALDDSGKSFAEIDAEGKSAIAGKHTVWHELTDWLEAKDKEND